MRLAFFVLAVAGAAIAFGYPWMVGHQPAETVGRLELLDRGGGASLAVLPLRPDDGPLDIRVEATAEVRRNGQPEGTLLTLRAFAGGRQVLDRPLSWRDASVRTETPQSFLRTYAIEAGTFRPEATGDHSFSILPGGIDGVTLKGVSLELARPKPAIDPRVRTAGLSALAAGLVGLAVAVWRRRRQKPELPGASQRPRWGRGPDRAA